MQSCLQYGRLVKYRSPSLTSSLKVLLKLVFKTLKLNVTYASMNLHMKVMCEYTFKHTMQPKHNRVMHALNGNPDILNKQITIIQVNSLNANFDMNIYELIVTTESHKADIVVISESNIDTNNPIKMTERANKFARFTIINKIIPPHDKYGITLMIDNDIKFTCTTQHEDTENPMIVVKIKKRVETS